MTYQELRDAPKPLIVDTAVIVKLFPGIEMAVEGHFITSTTCPLLPSMEPYSGVPVPDHLCPGCGEVLDRCSACKQLHCINPDCDVIVPGLAAS